MMGNKKKQTEEKFPPELLREWENTDGVNFAIALARASGWLLQVTWFGFAHDDPAEQLKSLRVYVATDGVAVYDFNGRKLFPAFHQYVIQPLEKARKYPGSVYTTRFYSEEKLWQLPLRIKPSEAGIARAEEALREYPFFLAKMQRRLNPHIPARVAASFTYSKCAVFAAAKEQISGLPAMAIKVSRYETGKESRIGFCHSVVVHPDGDWEDAWGKQSPAYILKRHAISAYSLSAELQAEVVAKLRQNSPEQFAAYEQEARVLLTNGLAEEK